MAKRRYDIDEKKIARFFKEGRGQGHGADYKPWITIHDLSSQGRSTRIFSHKTGRIHQLLSDLETRAFHNFNDNVKFSDIREQFPLDRNETRQIAREMGVKHPADTRTKTDIVMTSDFVLDLRGQLGRVAVRSVKPVKELNAKRTLEKLEIERRYWLRRSDWASWAFVLDVDLPRQRARTLQWLHEMYSLQHLEVLYPGYWQERCEAFLTVLNESNFVHFRELNHYLIKRCGFKAGEPITALRHLGATKQLPINKDVAFRMSMRLDVLFTHGEINKPAFRSAA